MFKRWKDLLAEETQNLQSSVQQFAQSVSSASTLNSGDKDEDQCRNQANNAAFSGVKSSSSFQEVDLCSPSALNSVSRSSLASDMDSCSEFDDSQSINALDAVTKEELYSKYRAALQSCDNYRNKYVSVRAYCKTLENDTAKAKAMLTESQDKSLKRISELREQCSLDRTAKELLEEHWRLELEEKDHKISILETQIKLLKNDDHNKQSTELISFEDVEPQTKKSVDENNIKVTELEEKVASLLEQLEQAGTVEAVNGKNGSLQAQLKNKDTQTEHQNAFIEMQRKYEMMKSRNEILFKLLLNILNQCKQLKVQQSQAKMELATTLRESKSELSAQLVAVQRLPPLLRTLAEQRNELKSLRKAHCHLRDEFTRWLKEVQAQSLKNFAHVNELEEIRITKLMCRALDRFTESPSIMTIRLQLLNEAMKMLTAAANDDTTFECAYRYTLMCLPMCGANVSLSMLVKMHDSNSGVSVTEGIKKKSRNKRGPSNRTDNNERLRFDVYRKCSELEDIQLEAAKRIMHVEMAHDGVPDRLNVLESLLSANEAMGSAAKEELALVEKMVDDGILDSMERQLKLQELELYAELSHLKQGALTHRIYSLKKGKKPSGNSVARFMHTNILASLHSKVEKVNTYRDQLVKKGVFVDAQLPRLNNEEFFEVPDRFAGILTEKLCEMYDEMARRDGRIKVFGNLVSSLKAETLSYKEANEARIRQYQLMRNNLTQLRKFHADTKKRILDMKYVHGSCIAVHRSMLVSFTLKMHTTKLEAFFRTFADVIALKNELKIFKRSVFAELTQVNCTMFELNKLPLTILKLDWLGDKEAQTEKARCRLDVELKPGCLKSLEKEQNDFDDIENISKQPKFRIKTSEDLSEEMRLSDVVAVEESRDFSDLPNNKTNLTNAKNGLFKLREDIEVLRDNTSSELKDFKSFVDNIKTDFGRAVEAYHNSAALLDAQVQLNKLKADHAVLKADVQDRYLKFGGKIQVMTNDVRSVMKDQRSKYVIVLSKTKYQFIELKENYNDMKITTKNNFMAFTNDIEHVKTEVNLRIRSHANSNADRMLSIATQLAVLKTDHKAVKNFVKLGLHELMRDQIENPVLLNFISTSVDIYNNTGASVRKLNNDLVHLKRDYRILRTETTTDIGVFFENIKNVKSEVSALFINLRTHGFQQAVSDLALLKRDVIDTKVIAQDDVCSLSRLITNFRNEVPDLISNLVTESERSCTQTSEALMKAKEKLTDLKLCYQEVKFGANRDLHVFMQTVDDFKMEMLGSVKRIVNDQQLVVELVTQRKNNARHHATRSKVKLDSVDLQTNYEIVRNMATDDLQDLLNIVDNFRIGLPMISSECLPKIKSNVIDLRNDYAGFKSIVDEDLRAFGLILGEYRSKIPIAIEKAKSDYSRAMEMSAKRYADCSDALIKIRDKVFIMKGNYSSFKSFVSAQLGSYESIVSAYKYSAPLVADNENQLNNDTRNDNLLRISVGGNVSDFFKTITTDSSLVDDLVNNIANCSGQITANVGKQQNHYSNDNIKKVSSASFEESTSCLGDTECVPFRKMAVQENLSKLRDSLKLLDEQYDLYRMSLTDIKDTVTNLQGNYAVLKGGIGNDFSVLTKFLDDYKHRLHEVMESVDCTRCWYSELSDQLVDSKRRCESLDAENKALLENKHELDAKLNELSHVLNDLQADSNGRLQTMEEEHADRIKQLVLEYNTMLARKDIDYDEQQTDLYSKFDKEKSNAVDETNRIIRELQEDIHTLQEQLLAKNKEWEEVKHECETKEMLFEKHRTEMIDDCNSKLKENDEKWKLMLDKKLKEIELKFLEETEILKKEWKTEIEKEDSKNITGSSKLLGDCTKEYEESVALKNQIESLTKELKELTNIQKQNKNEVTDVELKNDSSAADMNVSDFTEMEYLRNVLYQYMMGNEPLVLAKVLAAIVKFNSEQTTQILQKEEQKLSLFGQLRLM